jgi:protease-4
MFAYLIYFIRNLFRHLGNLLRRLGKAPDYVIFTLEGEYPECWEPVGGFIQRRLRPPRLSIQELAAQLRIIGADARVQGIVVHLRSLEMEQARLESLRDLLVELRAAGKRVVAWATRYSLATYYVACAADEILLQPGGEIVPLGLRRTHPYLAEALARVGVKADFVQSSLYKSAASVFTRKDMSDEEREMSNWLMDATFSEIIAAIVEGRRISEDEARELVDNTPCTDLKAIEIGAVDGVLNEEDLPEYLKVGEKPAHLATWEDAGPRLFRRPLTIPGRYVVLLTIEGFILDGESGRPPVKPPLPLPILMEERAGDLSVVQAARKALKDKRAEAVVLYVNSRGGSATASEAMRAALEKIDEVKPLFVSMGSVAASGGFWVSMPGRYIFAQPGTITGSIGVVFGKVVLGELLDKLLFGRETISRGKHSLIEGFEEPFTDEQRELLWESHNRLYDMFLDLVSKSRKMTRESVDAVGRGRVWTGRQALEKGLVDEMGGLDHALARAREMAGLHERTPVRVITADRRVIPPVSVTAATMTYVLESARLFQWGTPLLLCPLGWFGGIAPF